MSARIELAIAKAGGLRPLARLLAWSPPSLIKVRDGERISPYRAIQLASYLGLSHEDQERAMYLALAELAKADAEREYWINRVETIRLRDAATQQALETWAASGSKSVDLLRKLEQSIFAELVSDAAIPASAQSRKKSA